MKIDLSKIDQNEFNVREGDWGDEKLYLVTPKSIAAKWTKENMIFRSSVWTADGDPVSLSFKKFFNFDEQPELAPKPKNMKGVSLIEKIDGSALIVSFYKKDAIIRTRGTFDARNLDNGSEIAFLKEKYPLAFSNLWIRNNYTLIFEWTTPSNVIVLSYGPEPRLFLVGAIYHENYSYVPQKQLDEMAVEFGVERPKRYNFDSMEEMIQAVIEFKDKEGLVIYYNGDQSLKKVKSASYLALHSFKNSADIESIVDLFLEQQRPSYEVFMGILKEKFDYECATYAQPFVSRVCDAQKEVEKILSHMKKFVEPLKSESRKTAAEKILGAYGNTNRSGIAFHLLDGKEPEKKDWKRLLLQTDNR
jgi:hypothetical protein